MRDFIKEMTTLKNSKLVLIHIEDRECFVDKCINTGLNPQGGAIYGEYQYIYID